MKKAMLGGEGKSDIHSGKPKEILTHITSAHDKPNIFHGEPGEHAPNMPTVSEGHYANTGKSKMC